MRIELKRVNDAFHFEATGTSSVAVHIDASPDTGGSDAGARPMELLLMGLGGCSGIDVIEILKKQRQPLGDIRISIEAERRKNAIPAVFETIHIHFQFKGDLDRDKVQKAILLSLKKYCSAAAMLEHTAKITHSFEIVGTGR